MKFKIGSWDTGQTWNVIANNELSAMTKILKKNRFVNANDLHCISCTHSTSELKTKKMMTKQQYRKKKAMGKSLTGYVGNNTWTLVFTTKSGDRFRKGFKSEASMNRAMAGWTAAGGKVKWKPSSLVLMRGSRGKRRS